MKYIVKRPFAGIVSVICGFLMIGSVYLADAQEHNVRAKIGIQINSAGGVARAKSEDRLNVGDLLRIYVHPEKTSCIYVVYSDQNEATLLNVSEKKRPDATLVMPSPENFYQVDGKSEKECFTVIVSPDELPEIYDIFKTGKASYSRWVEVEKRLVEKGKIDLSREVQKPFAIAGNVRGVPGIDISDPFASNLQIFSGKSVLVKKYEFRVQK